MLLLFSAIPGSLNAVFGIHVPENHSWFCFLRPYLYYSGYTSSTFFILSMTFERFYSIIRPHKAASVNTPQKAKITIACAVVFSFSYHFAHLPTARSNGRMCVYSPNLVYYWFSIFLRGILPFMLLLVMNSVIIHTLRQRSKLILRRSRDQGQPQGQNESSNTNIKQSERQIYLMLLFVTFTFLICITPFYTWALLFNFYKSNSPHFFAGLVFLQSVASAAMYANCGINFFLYVISGHKFREDLVNLFSFCKNQKDINSVQSIKTERMTVPLENKHWYFLWFL